jgi:hypothetical protein
MRRTTALVVATSALLVATAGACEERGTNDAPIDLNLQDDTAPYIINMPDGYMNLALKCIGDDLVIAHTREAAPLVVESADVCREGGPIPQADLSGDS